MFRLIALLACLFSGWHAYAYPEPIQPPKPPRSGDVSVVLEFGGLGSALESSLGMGVAQLAKMSGANLRPDLHDAWQKLWKELNLEAYTSKLLSRRAAFVSLHDGSWAIASEMDAGTALKIVKKLGATPRGIGTRGALLSIKGGRYSGVLRSGRSIDGQADDQLATLILAPERSDDLVRLLSDKLLGGAGFLPEGQRLGDTGWIRGFLRVQNGLGGDSFVSFEARAGERSWRLTAHVSRELIAPERPATLSGLDKDVFEQLTRGSAVGVAGIIDQRLARRTPILGAIIQLLPPEQLAQIEGKPAVVIVYVDQEQQLRRATLLTLVRTPIEPARLDIAIGEAAANLGLVDQSPEFDGFRPAAERVALIDGPTNALIVPIVGEPPTLRWGRVSDDGWWALRLGCEPTARDPKPESQQGSLSLVRDALDGRRADDDAREISFGVVSPNLIATTPRAAGVMSRELSDTFLRVGEVRWRTWLVSDDRVGVEMDLRGP